MFYRFLTIIIYKGKVNLKLNMLGQLIVGIHSAVNLMRSRSLLLLVNYVFATIEGSSFLQQIIFVLGLLIVSKVEYRSAILIFLFDG